MFRNYLSAALGNIGRNGPYAAITILGLAVSFTAAILIGLYVRDEFSFDRFVAGHEGVYRVKLDLLYHGQKPRPIEVVQSTAAGNLRLDFPEIQSAARLEASPGALKIGDWSSGDWVGWADPDFFTVMPYPVVAGDPNVALAAPDGLVLTRAAARQYFHEDRPIGRIILVNAGLDGRPGLPPDEQKIVSGFHPMRVMAVLDDPPSSSHLTAKIFAASRAPFSPVSVDDRHPNAGTQDLMAYVRLRPGASPAGWTQRLQTFSDRRYAGPPGEHSSFRFWLAPLDALHFMPMGTAPTAILRPSADRRVDLAIAAIGALIVAIAAINFVTLMTARAARRAVEVGVRKAAGARRRDLVVQFMGEALIYVAIAAIMAVVAAELTLPGLNAFLQRSLRFDYLADPVLIGALAAATLLTSLLAGAYPALVLSSFRPAAALKGGMGLATGSVVVRQGLVIAQFAILIGLIVMTATIYRQTHFILNDALRADIDQVVRLLGPCGSAFEREASGVPGVKAVACASGQALQLGTSQNYVRMPDHSERMIYNAPLGAGFLELHGLKPVAGRFFSKARGEDVLLDRPDASIALRPTIVLNEAAVRFLGFSSPAAAVGKTVTWQRWAPAGIPNGPPPFLPSQVIGVSPDFSLGSVRTAVTPTIFYVEPVQSRFLVAKLDRSRMPEALEGLRRLWRRTGHETAMNNQFETQAVQALYQDVITQGVCLGICAGLAIVIACLGLFALAAFVTERRIKEIGVRKAMGASSGDVVKLLLWQFSQPVLWANLVAWPAAFFAMDYWLHGFAYRVSQPAWLFAAAAAAAALIAWVTVSFQSLMAARSKPAAALRYE
jgi:putative ABC transport system permease protein